MCYRGPPVTQRFHSTPGQRVSQNRYATDQPPADIADSILTNPWTAALVQWDSDRPQLYCNSAALTRVGLGSWAPEAAARPQGLQASPQDKCPSAAEKTGSQGTIKGRASQGITEDADSQDNIENTASRSTAASSCSEVHGSQTAAEPDGHSADSMPAKLSVPAGHSPVYAYIRKPAGNGERRPCSEGEKQPSYSCSSMQGDDGCQVRKGSHLPGRPSPSKGGPPHPGNGACQGIEAVQQHEGSPSGAASGAQQACLHPTSSDSSRADRQGCNAAQAQSTSNADWAAAFTGRCGKQNDGAGHCTAATRCDAGADKRTGSAKQRGFTSWIGNFGHLDGPRFTKQQGKAWQTYMRSQKDQPAESPCSTGSVPEVRPSLV